LALHHATTHVYGTLYDDTFVGGPEDDLFSGSSGRDTIEGGGGDDILSASDGTISGGDGNDELTGYANTGEVGASLSGGAGDDLLHPGLAAPASAGPGDDTVQLVNYGYRPFTTDTWVDGGEGNDTLEFIDDEPYPAQAVFDMATGSLDVDTVHFVAAGFEQLWAHPWGVPTNGGRLPTAWQVTGTDGPNRIIIDYTGGVVVVYGAGGDDYLESSLADDTLVGGPGSDQADAKDGTDTCRSIEVATSCEVLEP
jgi:Ca2+-binding RTX toxin-like protein